MLDPLLAALADFYDTRPEGDDIPLFGRVSRSLRAADGSTTPDAAALPVADLLADAQWVADPAAARVGEAFRVAAHRCPWTRTAAYVAATPAATPDRYGYVKVFGPASIVEADGVAVGIGVWDGLHYPMHHHEAEEAYHVLAGSPRFRTPDGEWRSLGPGETFHQPPWAPHEQVFGSEPCVLLWAWGGAVTEPASLVDTA